MTGLSKAVFFNHLAHFSVVLCEHEKALISSVFGLQGLNADKMDYQKVDTAFEGVQQLLYAQGKY